VNRLKDNVKKDAKEKGCEVVDGIKQSQNRVQLLYLENTVMTLLVP
jgi:ribose 5-phosphate isomerase RpiB